MLRERRLQRCEITTTVSSCGSSQMHSIMEYGICIKSGNCIGSGELYRQTDGLIYDVSQMYTHTHIYTMDCMGRDREKYCRTCAGGDSVIHGCTERL